jgi:hypothetical protein
VRLLIVKRFNLKPYFQFIVLWWCNGDLIAVAVVAGHVLIATSRFDAAATAMLVAVDKIARITVAVEIVAAAVVVVAAVVVATDFLVLLGKVLGVGAYVV